MNGLFSATYSEFNCESLCSSYFCVHVPTPSKTKQKQTLQHKNKPKPNTNTEQRTHILTHARTHARTYSRTHARTYVHTHTHTHAHTHTHTHAHTHTHTHIHTIPLIWLFGALQVVFNTIITIKKNQKKSVRQLNDLCLTQNLGDRFFKPKKTSLNFLSSSQSLPHRI